MLCQFIDDTVADGFLFSVFGSIVNILEGASNVNRLAFSRATDILAPRFDFSAQSSVLSLRRLLFMT